MDLLRLTGRGTGFLAVLSFLAAGPWTSAHAAQVAYSSAFSIPHTGSVSTGLLSIGGTFTNTTTASAAAATLPQFNPSLGRLTKVTATITTSGATFSVAPTGLLSLISTASVMRRLSYGVGAGASSVAEAAEVTSDGGVLLTLLGLGGGEIGGAALNRSTTFTASADLARYTGSGTLPLSITATDTFTVFALVSALYGGGLQGSGTYGGNVSITYEYTPWAIGGYVYNDADHDGVRAPAEAGTGLTLYAKLVQGGVAPATQVVAVDPVTGRYGFNVARGNYRVVIDDNANASDITPLQPPLGWAATQAETMARDLAVGTDAPSQDFGLVHATLLKGRSFIDNGAGGGVASDGIANGSEPGSAGRQLVLTLANGTELDRTTTAGDGSFRLYIPYTTAVGTALKLKQAPDATLLASGGNVGNTGGSYNRGSDELSFTFAVVAQYSGVTLGSVALPTLTPGGRQAGTGGATLTYSHQFVAPAAGTVTFTLDAPAAWPTTLYLDVAGNGLLDAADHPLTAPLQVVAGQTVSVLVKLNVPETLTADARSVATLSASFAYANSGPALAYVLSATDLSQVAAPGSATLVLLKSADTASVLPGGTVVYTTVYTNSGTTPLSDIVINDATPAFTVFAWASADTVAGGPDAPSITAPAVGAKGAIRWAFTGLLAPGASGVVRFAVKVE